MDMKTYPWSRPVGVGEVPTNRPLVLCDIDGCLNVAEPVPTWLEDDELGHDSYVPDCTKTIEYPEDIVGLRNHVGVPCPKHTVVRWSSELARAIAKASDNNLASFVWLTSWCEFSKFFEETLWPDRESPFIGYLPWRLRGFSDPGIHGKTLAVNELLGCPWSRHERNWELRDWDENDGRDKFGRYLDEEWLDVPAIAVVDDNDRWAYHDDDGGLFKNAVGDVCPELTIAPEPWLGITRGEWNRLMTFLKAHVTVA